jgi:hypothetical protein
VALSSQIEHPRAPAHATSSQWLVISALRHRLNGSSTAYVTSSQTVFLSHQRTRHRPCCLHQRMRHRLVSSHQRTRHRLKRRCCISVRDIVRNVFRRSAHATSSRGLSASAHATSSCKVRISACVIRCCLSKKRSDIVSNGLRDQRMRHRPLGLFASAHASSSRKSSHQSTPSQKVLRISSACIIV